MIEAFKSFWKNATNANGRTGRANYWYMILLNGIIGGITKILPYEEPFITITMIILLYILVCIVPNFTLTVRRLHDINKSAWWILMALVPIIGPIILIIFYASPSVEENNKYGPRV